MGIDDLELEAAGRGWWGSDDQICSQCVADDAPIEAIRRQGEDQPCSFCQRTPSHPEASAPLNLILDLVVTGIRSEYARPVDGLAWDEGEYIGAVHDTHDLLWDLEITDNEAVHRALVDRMVEDQWCAKDFYAPSPLERIVHSWERFRSFVKHRRRYTFLAPQDTTARRDPDSIPMERVPAEVARTIVAAERVVTLPSGTPWWRVRVHASGESVHTASDIGPAPAASAKDNRMTPQGITAFYGASSLEGAVSEVAAYAKPQDEGSAGCFITTRDLTVVDLQRLPPVPSLFDAAQRSLRNPMLFLHGFVSDVRIVAAPGQDQGLENVPTQVIAEYLRRPLPGLGHGADGILWRSTKDNEATCCVLFVTPEMVADQGHESEATSLVLDPSSVRHLPSLQPS
ncbi:hypothetical protein CGZ98_03470 [Enemella evansiae]|uniref:HEPN-associated N-terminal domain-containing protein n=1 Tax=Enemella evansiae TaxID=2016499 RepID=UPI000B978B18|nr:HEPN-associated N-terminal domain-containing protein [Enemella evansiae]OYO15479.1 hypothetical protein CGZ98_03470 [Enemella evansiae]